MIFSLLLFLLFNFALALNAISTMDKSELSNLVGVKPQFQKGFSKLNKWIHIRPNKEIIIHRMPEDNRSPLKNVALLSKIADRLKFAVLKDPGHPGDAAGCTQQLISALGESCAIVKNMEQGKGQWDCECYDGIVHQQRGIGATAKSYLKILHNAEQRKHVEGMEGEWQTYVQMDLEFEQNIHWDTKLCGFEIIFNRNGQTDYILLMQREKVPEEMRLELFTATPSPKPISSTEEPTSSTTATEESIITTTSVTKITRPIWTWPPGLENSKLFGLFDEITKPTPSKKTETLTTENPKLIAEYH